jgi:hypothetical protein
VRCLPRRLTSPAAWLLLVELTGNWLYVTPAWKPVSLRLLGH